MKIDCKHCGQPFEPKSKSQNQRFCSPKCKWTWTNQNRTLKPNVFGTCKVCGVKFERYVEPYKIKHGGATNEYCSRKCKGIALSGDNHPYWKGGRVIVNGYVWKHAPDHPHAKHQGYVLEHRLVVEEHLGRLLTQEEVVHHKDGNSLNNSIENLELFASNGEHMKQHHAERLRDKFGRYLPKVK